MGSEKPGRKVSSHKSRLRGRIAETVISVLASGGSLPANKLWDEVQDRLGTVTRNDRLAAIKDLGLKVTGDRQSAVYSIPEKNQSDPLADGED